jgi:glutamate dehydrogenase (NADP+)
MAQNSERLSWSFEEVDEKLHAIMKEIFANGYKHTLKYGKNVYDLKTGSDIAGFEKVAEAMLAQGI